MARLLDLKKHTLFLIRGASRGIGQAVAMEMSKKLANNSVAVLIGSTEDGLDLTKATIAVVNKKVKVQCYGLELSEATPAEINDLLEAVMKCSGNVPTDFERAIIIHSGDDVCKHISDSLDTENWSRCYKNKLFSTIMLNNEFCRFFEEIPKIVVNISSGFSTKPYAGMGFYGSVTAARNTYFRGLAAENKTNMLVLNYAPGKVDTASSHELQEHVFGTLMASGCTCHLDASIILTSMQIAEDFIKILENQKLKSGDVIDYSEYIYY